MGIIIGHVTYRLVKSPTEWHYMVPGGKFLDILQRIGNQLLRKLASDKCLTHEAYIILV